MLHVQTRTTRTRRVRASCSKGGILPAGRIASTSCSRAAASGALESGHATSATVRSTIRRFAFAPWPALPVLFAPDPSLAKPDAPVGVIVSVFPMDEPTDHVVQLFPQFAAATSVAPPDGAPAESPSVRQFGTFPAANRHAPAAPRQSTVSRQKIQPAGKAEHREHREHREDAEDADYAARARQRGLAGDAVLAQARRLAHVPEPRCTRRILSAGHRHRLSPGQPVHEQHGPIQVLLGQPD